VLRLPSFAFMRSPLRFARLEDILSSSQSQGNSQFSTSQSYGTNSQSQGSGILNSVSHAYKWQRSKTKSSSSVSVEKNSVSHAYKRQRSKEKSTHFFAPCESASQQGDGELHLEVQKIQRDVSLLVKQAAVSANSQVQSSALCIICHLPFFDQPFGADRAR
jgi:hypothetical protein